MENIFLFLKNVWEVYVGVIVLCSDYPPKYKTLCVSTFNRCGIDRNQP